MLVNAGADPSIKNTTNHDAVYEAENNGKDEVVSWLLLEGKGLETEVKGAKEEESDVKEASHDDEERELKEKEAVSIAEAENGLKDLDPKGREEGARNVGCRFKRHFDIRDLVFHCEILHP